MALERLYWLAIAACGLHIVEEYLLDWRGWVRSVTGIDLSEMFFLVSNGFAMLLGVVFAAVAPKQPVLGLAIPALMLINATFFHVGSFLWTRGKFSPGLITAVTLFYPIGIWCFKSAYDGGILTAPRVVGSFAIAALFMAAPMAGLRASGLRRI